MLYLLRFNRLLRLAFSGPELPVATQTVNNWYLNCTAIGGKLIFSYFSSGIEENLICKSGISLSKRVSVPQLAPSRSLTTFFPPSCRANAVLVSCDGAHLICSGETELQRI